MNDNYMTKEIPYTEAHVCRSNGVGDYEMVCPKAGVLPGFVTFMSRTMLSGKCSGCGKTIKSKEK